MTLRNRKISILLYFNHDIPKLESLKTYIERHERNILVIEKRLKMKIPINVTFVVDSHIEKLDPHRSTGAD